MVLLRPLSRPVFIVPLSVFLFCWVWVSVASLIGAADITYVYNDLGRLIAVVDEAGETAVYQYDAVGNLLTISRRSSATVSIIAFTPSTGPVGTVVTISGTGFSSTASQNTVKFRGVMATVTSASATQLVAKVPSGATTGTISVITPTGSATSATSFTVGAKPPTISGFSPTIATVGTAVTLLGTNFDPTPATNTVRFNVTPSAVTAGTKTSLATSVPSGGTSGHLSVTTSGGTAVSSEDFFIPPSPYGAADVAATGRMTIGGPSKTVTIALPNKIALILFDGTAGRQISLTLSSTIDLSTVSLYNPDGTTLVGATPVYSTGAFIDTHTLPATGTYTILIAPASPLTGNMTLTLYAVPDVTGTIAINGSPVTATLSAPGQKARYTFTGTAGQQVNLGLTNVSLTSASVSLLRPGGTTLASLSVSSAGGSLDPPLLPTSGTYTILVDPTGTYTGASTLTLSKDLTGTLTIGATPKTVTISRPGQNARYTFTGTAGRQVTVRVTTNTMSCVTVSLLKPGNIALTSSFSCSASFNLAPQTLPLAGTYTITIDPNGTTTGSLSLSVTSP